MAVRAGRSGVAQKSSCSPQGQGICCILCAVEHGVRARILQVAVWVRTLFVKFLQIFANSLGQDPRPTRFYSLLRTLGSVTVCAAPPVAGFAPPELFFNLEKAPSSLPRKICRTAGLLCHRYERDIWTPRRRAIFDQLKGQDFSAIICQEGLLVPLALAVREARGNRNKSCPVILDAREFYPRQFEQSFVWRTVLGGVNRYVCRTYFPRLDRIFTVSPGLAQGYREEYGLDCELLPSCPSYHDITPAPAHDGPVRCIHHGAASSGRKLEVMLEAFRMLEGIATLDVMLVPNEPDYYEKLRRLAGSACNIRFLDPVPMNEIVARISGHDVGVFLLPDNTFNHRHCLPNKFFEYVQARLALAITPLPDMSAMLRQYDLGVIAADFSPQAFAAAIRSLTPESIARFKQHADSAARTLCWENNDARLRKTLFALMED